MSKLNTNPYYLQEFSEPPCVNQNIEPIIIKEKELPPKIEHREPKSPPYIPPFKINVKPKKTNSIKSYGIINFMVDRNQKKVYFLLMKRRDSLTYNTIIRGHYTYEQLLIYISLLSKSERERIIKYKYDFNKLWDDLWPNKKSYMYRSEYRNAKYKFELNSSKIVSIINNTSPNDCEDYLWEFPKGKRNNKEKNIDAALREFTEEVCIDNKLLTLFPYKSLLETYYGSNSKSYKTIYYPTVTSTRILPERIYQYNNCIREGSYISDEVDDVKWFTFEETIHIFRDRNYRQIIVKELYEHIMTLINN